ncbi:tetraspanin-9 isoform X1 [Leptinotarsa decemlineata]|uniref:tetraspanin-9 isoform X1 n=1 Tax=Leptinotarsa decemlineata TaxID=7539 RepID=UPI003D309862
MGCLSGISKYILFLFNLLILLAAIALIAIGVIYHNKNGGLDIMSVSSFTIAVGVIIALVSFFGCCGAVKESRCLLTTYAFVMITIFIIQVVLVVLAFLAIQNGDKQLDKEVEKYLNKLYQNLFVPERKAQLDIVNTLQTEFECCGINENYNLVTQNITTGRLIYSCCPSEYEENCTKGNCYKADCAVELRTFIEDNAKLIGGIAVGVAVVEILVTVFAFCVRSNISRKNSFV